MAGSFRPLFVIVLLLAITAWPVPGWAQTAARAAVASSLEPVMHELVAVYARETGQRLEPRYAASGRLALQIAAGVAADVFIAADRDHVAWLREQGFINADGQSFATSGLAYFVGDGGALTATEGLDSLGRALDRGTLGRFVIADPDHSPHGRAAREVLLEAGLWSALRNHLVLADDAAQAARFASGGSARAGLVPAHFVDEERLRRRGQAVAVAAELHRPLEYTVVVVNPQSAAGAAFAEFLTSEAARAVLQQYGLHQ